MKNIALFRRHGKACRGWMAVLWAMSLPVASSQPFVMTSARAVSLSGCSITQTDDPWAASTNWSAGVRRDQIGVAFGVIPAPYGLTELRIVAGAIHVPFAGGAGGLLMERMGGGLFRRQCLRVGAGVLVADGMALGGGITWTQEIYRNYGSASVVTADAGCLLSLPEGMEIAASCTNLSGRILGSPEVAPSRVMRLGAAWSPGSNWRFSTEAEKELRRPAALRAGLEFFLFDGVALRGGIGEEPARTAFGCSVRLGPAQVSYAADVHAELGWTHVFELDLAWGTRK